MHIYVIFLELQDHGEYVFLSLLDNARQFPKLFTSVYFNYWCVRVLVPHFSPTIILSVRYFNSVQSGQYVFVPGPNFPDY